MKHFLSSLKLLSVFLSLAVALALTFPHQVAYAYAQESELDRLINLVNTSIDTSHNISETKFWLAYTAVPRR